MPRNDAGEEFGLDNDDAIREINSPKDFVTGGPHVVVHTCDDQERWAVVTLDWEGEPALGMRWFHGGYGHPSRGGWATWVVIPTLLSGPLLDTLQNLPGARPNNVNTARQFLGLVDQ